MNTPQPTPTPHQRLRGSQIYTLGEIMPVLNGAVAFMRSEEWQERFPGEDAKHVWVNGAIYGAAGEFARRAGRTDEEIREFYDALCPLINELWAEYDGDLEEMVGAFLREVGEVAS